MGEGVGLVVRSISFQDFQPQMDGRTTCNLNAALCTIVHRAVKISADDVPVCLAHCQTSD